MIEEKIFKAYDIRGIYPDEINEAAAERIGKAFVKYTGAKKVAIGKDMRSSSPSITESIVMGIINSGADVVDIGMVSTPMLNFAVASRDDIDGGMIITASHNPSQYNGLKMVLSDAMPLGKGLGMEEIKDMVIKGEFEQAENKGSVEYTDVLDDYIKKIFRLVDVTKIKPMTIAIDCGNGINGPIIREICNRIPQLKVLELYYRPDGTFPNHEANPLKLETLKDLQTRVIMKNAEIGFAFDGDGDRLGVVDELGHGVSGDFLTCIFAEDLLRKEENRGSLINADLRSSWIVKETVEELGGKFEQCMVGHALIKNLMKKNNALFAGELSNHFYYRDFYKVESADLSLLLILSIVTEKNKTLSEIIEPLKKYFQSGEINSDVEDKDGVMKFLEEKYGPDSIEISKIDGIKIEYPDYWFSVRASNTEPVLRLNLEAKTKEKMEEMRDEILNIIRN